MKTVQGEDIFNIPTNNLLDIKVLEAWEKASHALGQVNQLSTSIFDLTFIIDTLKNIEALNSAKIEGTTGNLEDLYLQDALSFERKKELKLFSALNYKYTMNELERVINQYQSIDTAVIRHLHKLLTENDPATHGSPGEFRRLHVKIRNSKIGDFFPPAPMVIPDLVERFFQPIANIPEKSLLTIAIRHFQFESVHPFEDGNGRTGRILILAFLLQYKYLPSPILNISQFFEDNRDEYIFSLRAVTDRNDHKQWVLFFLRGVEEQSKKVVELIYKLRAIKEADEARISSAFRNTSVPHHLLKFALQNFFFTIIEFADYLKINNVPVKATYQTARNNILRFEKMGLIAKNHKRGQADAYVHIGLRSVLMPEK